MSCQFQLVFFQFFSGYHRGRQPSLDEAVDHLQETYRYTIVDDKVRVIFNMGPIIK